MKLESLMPGVLTALLWGAVALVPCVSIASVESNAAVEIGLNSKIEVVSARLVLSDIADIKCKDERICKQLMNLLIGKAPRPGYWGYITQHRLNALIKSKMPGMRQKKIIWSGPARVRIRSTGVELAESDIIKKADFQLESWLSDRYQNFSYEIVKDNITQILPQGEFRIIASLPKGIKLSKRMHVWIDIYVDDQHFQSLPVWYSVTVVEPVLVANAKLYKSDLPLKTQFLEMERDITYNPGKPVYNFSDLAGKRLKKDIQIGSIISEADFELIPAVAKGQAVTVLATAGKVSLQTKAVALNDGNVLQSIHVQSLKNDSRYSATVIGNGKVKVD